MAIPVQIIALQFGPLGTDGTHFSVPVHRVETVTEVSTTEEAIIRFLMPDDVDVEVQSALGFNIPVSTTPAFTFVALSLTTENSVYLFPRCRIDHGTLAPIVVSFTVFNDRNMPDDFGGLECKVIVNGSRRPVTERISFR